MIENMIRDLIEQLRDRGIVAKYRLVLSSDGEVVEVKIEITDERLV